MTRRYGDRVAVDGVTFAVRPGELFGFVGPKGAGKTTTMRIVLGVLAADRGTVRWRGAPVDLAVRARFGYMLVTLAAAAALVPLAARIYRGAVLQTGSAVKLREAWRAAGA